MLAISRTIFLEIANSNEEYKDIYKTKITEINNDSFFIQLPINQRTSKTDYFHKGSKLIAKLVLESGTVFQFPTEVIDHKVNKIPMIELMRPLDHEYKKIQRRAYVRVDMITEVLVKLGEDQAYEKATMSNVSGGGMSMIVPSSFNAKLNDILICKFKLPIVNGEVEIEEECKVVRVGDEAEEFKKLFLFFTNIKESERSKIIQFCFQKQLEQRRKGWE